MSDLRAALDEYRKGLSNYPIVAAHIFPDVHLFSLAVDVAEQAEAVAALAAGSYWRASFANARAAFDASIDLRYLTSAEDAYDERGARMRVFELFEAERLKRRADRITTTIPGGSEEIENAIRVDAAEWSRRSPDKGRLLVSAGEFYSRNPPGVGDHWSGLGRHDLYRHVGDLAESEAEMVKMIEVIYALLSIATHPRARAGQRIVEITSEDTLTLRSNPEHKLLPTEIAFLAVKTAQSALQRRSTFFGSAP